ncbi:MAG: long-chain fatty acid--CoA ligase [Chloroflexota bacterium]
MCSAAWSAVKDSTLIGTSLGAHAAERAGAPALTVIDHEGRPRTWTYGNLHARSAYIQERLRNAFAGETLALVVSGDPDTVATLLAMEALQRSVVLMPTRLPPTELAGVLRNCHVRFVIHAGELTISGPPHAERMKLSTELRVSEVFHEFTQENARPLDQSGWVAQLTSGSMGRSRLAVRTFDAVVCEIQAVGERLRLDASPKKSLLCTSSIAHSYGCVAGLLAPLVYGWQTILAGDVRLAVESGQLASSSIIVGLASTYRTMLNAQGAHHFLEQTRVALSAGAPLPDGLYDMFYERFGLPIRQDYGTTETGTIAIDAEEHAVPATVGHPLAHLQLRIAPVEDLHMQSPGWGEVQVCSPALAQHYILDGAPVPATDDQNWYHTGDMGMMDERGRLVIGPRVRRSIERASGRVHPETVERAVAQHPEVQEVVVLGVPAQGKKILLKAVVVAPDLTDVALRDWINLHLPAAQIPDLVEIRQDLPRSPAGKLLQKYMDGLESPPT